MTEHGDAIPLTILTGFLGAGKTTLLNRMLHAPHGLRTAVLVNDFGSINIDTQLVVGVEGETVSLSNGCICCTIRDDLLLTVLRLLKRPEPPEYIIIEASGVSDPWAVAETFQLPQLRHLVALDGIVAVVDAEYVRQQEGYADLIVDQISAADIVVLNKIDLVDDAQCADVRAWVQQVAPQARILEATHADVPLELLLGVGRFRTLLESVAHEHEHHDHDHDHEHHDHDHDHSDAFGTWSYTTAQPFAFKALREAILGLPTSVFRAKGVLALAEAPSRRAIFQLVGPRASVTLSEPWGDEAPRTQLVLIGTPGGLDGNAMQRRFDDCLGAPVLETAVGDQTWMRGATP